MLDYLKAADYPFVIPKSSILSPNNSYSWPYNFAAFIYLKDLYIAAGLHQNSKGSESFSDTLGIDVGEDNIDVFDDDFMKSFAVLTEESEDITELKRMTNILASNDMQFRALNAEGWASKFCIIRWLVCLEQINLNELFRIEQKWVVALPLIFNLLLCCEE